MKYLIVQDWKSTHGNHAGMVHMCKLLAENYPTEYTIIKKDSPSSLPERNLFIYPFVHHMDKLIWKKRWRKNYMEICQPMFKRLKSGDEVFLLEYNHPEYSQLEIAKYIKQHFYGVKVYALSHLTPTAFKSLHAERYILHWAQYVDKLLTLGSSLSSYFKDVGVPKEKISTGFHYVDSNYYSLNDGIVRLNERLTIITMGNLQRDFEMLAEIVRNCPFVNWIICIGRKKVESLFEESENVQIVGYVSEEELKELMSNADVSLNVLEDTVGSNVITTSLAMGLAVVANDVGSVKDYVDDDCGLLCDNTIDSFCASITKLYEDRELLLSKRRSALRKSRSFVIQNVNEWFVNLNH